MDTHFRKKNLAAVHEILKEGTRNGSTCFDTEDALENAVQLIGLPTIPEVQLNGNESITHVDWHRYPASLVATMFHVKLQIVNSVYSFFDETGAVNNDALTIFEMLRDRIRYLSIEVLGEEDTHYMNLVAKAWNEHVNVVAKTACGG